MSLERRLAVCAVLFLGTIPLGASFFPHVTLQLALGLIPVLATALVVLLPSSSFVQRGAGTLGALVLVALTASSVPIATPLLGSLPAVAAAVAGGPSWMVVAGLVSGIGLLGALGEETIVLGLADFVGLLLVVGWAVGLGARVASLARRRRLVRSIEAGRLALSAAMDAELSALNAIARRLTQVPDAMTGARLHPDALGLASVVDGDRVVVGWIEGEPLGTISVAWALRAAAIGGETDPAALLRIARVDLDEVLPAGCVNWIGVYDRTHGALVWTASDGEVRSLRASSVIIGPRGPGDVAPTSVGSVWPETSGGDVAIAPTPVVPALALLGVGILVGCLGLGPVGGTLALLATGLVHLELRRRAAATVEIAMLAEARIEELIEGRDDRHRVLGRMHGSMLPYRVASGGFEATAHRLRGDSLDGTFADVFVDAERRLCVLAGEVAGEGVAPRFLGLAAQISGRIALTRGASWPQLRAALLVPLRADATALGYPLRLALGVASVHADGRCVGRGTLQSLVRVDGGTRPTIVSESRFDDARIYLSPATARPGPEDDAPRLAPAEAARRVCGLVSAGAWSHERESLASLFALVFNGRDAPPHGTLIELRRAAAATTTRAA